MQNGSEEKLCVEIQDQRSKRMLYGDIMELNLDLIGKDNQKRGS